MLKNTMGDDKNLWRSACTGSGCAGHLAKTKRSSHSKNVLKLYGCVPFAVDDTPHVQHPPTPSCLEPGTSCPVEPGTSEPRNLGPGRTAKPEPGTWNPNSKFFSARLRRAVRTRNLEPAHTGGRNRNLGTLYGAESLIVTDKNRYYI